MRIISQDGRIDVPYEMTALHECHGSIRMNMAGDTGRGTEMAVYSTEEKAQAVMEELRKKYEDYQTYNGIYDYPKVFRFPPDEEGQP